MGQSGVMICYTCKNEFRSYHELMNHRKEEHPSHKKCRYYLKGECNFSAQECWYLHEISSLGSEKIHVEKETFNCSVCKNNFTSKNDLMQHKNKYHPINHPPKQNAWDKPLPHLPKQDFYQPPPTAAPDQGPLMEALNMLNQRLQAIEEKMFPQSI